jgi:hypothetical protein
VRSEITVVALLCLAFSFACGDVKKGGPAKACAKEYEQCTMPNGVLGVCNAVDCAEGHVAPCLVCRSQH